MKARRFAGLTALASALLVAGILLYDALIFSNEGTTEFFLIAAPFLLAPAILRTTHRHASPLQTAIRLVTWVALGAFVAVSALSFLVEGAVLAESSVLQTSILFLMGVVSLMGLSVAVSNGVALEAAHQPSVLSVLGIMAGIAWMVPLWGAILAAVDPALAPAAGSFLQTLYSLAAPAWLVSHLLYAVWKGLRLVLRGGSPLPAAAS